MVNMQTLSHQNHAKSASAALIVAGLIVVIPFLLPHHEQAIAFYSEWMAFVFGITACFPFVHKAFWSPLRIPQAAIWLFAFVILIAAQTLVVTPVYVSQALLPGIYLTWATVLVILGSWIRKQLGVERAVTMFAWMLLIGGVLSSMVGLVQHFDASGKLAFLVDQKAGSAFGNIGQRNHFATQITLASFALIYLHAIERVNRAVAIVLLALLSLMLTASSSRAALIYIVAGIFLTLISYRAIRAPIHRRLLQGVVLLLVLFLVFQFFLPLLNDWLKLLLAAMGFDINGLNTLVMLQRDAAGGIDLRLSEWHKAWRMFMESPLWGIGIGNYGWYSFNYQALPEFSAVPEGVLFNHSHNLIMQVLAELGILGFLLLLPMAVTWIKQMLPEWKNPSSWLILSLLIVLLLHSSVEYPLWYSYFLGIAAILLGLGSRAAVKVEFTPSLGQFTAVVTLIFSAAILIITLLGVQAIDVNRLIITSTPQQAGATLQAVSKNPLLTPWAEAAVALHGTPAKEIIEQQLLLSTRVLHYRPNPPFVNRQIVYLALAGKSTEASTMVKKAFIVYPSDFSKFACGWKRAPAHEVQALWQEAEKLAGSAVECQTESGTSVGPS